ncbi:MAG: GlxA family transcriptional regulator [Owenweeksia sp.]
MKHVSILIPKGNFSVVNVDGTHQILSHVNQFMIAKGALPVFNIQLVGLEDSGKQNGLISIQPEAEIAEVKKTDLIFVPAIFGDPVAAAEQNRDFIPWLQKQYHGGAEIATYCVGAFFMAQTGLLDGKQCATHWTQAANFRAMFPNIDLVDDMIMTAEDGVYTSGGAYSYLNLLLYLIEKYAGREMAILISKTFMIDIDKHSQSPFIIFEGQKSHEDEPVKKAQEYIEENYMEKITVNEIAEKFALGRRSLERRFKKATCNTVSEYIQRVKIEAAKKSLETGSLNVNEVMYDVGYSDTKAFRTTFKKITGLTPVEYRNRYNREMQEQVA